MIDNKMQRKKRFYLLTNTQLINIFYFFSSFLLLMAQCIVPDIITVVEVLEIDCNEPISRPVQFMTLKDKEYDLKSSKKDQITNVMVNFICSCINKLFL